MLKQIYLFGIVILLAGNMVSAMPFESTKESEQSQQGIRITGSVSDNMGVPIPGVAVVVKGTTTGTSTDINGEFTIIAPDENAVLEFSSMGFQTRETIVGSRRVIAVSLDEEAAELGEVVVTAFGTQKKESNVASIETVNVADLKIPSTNLTSAFAGRVSGMITLATTGEPGNDNAEFFIRGVTTFSLGGRSTPLILIDGFESTIDDLARITPDDIESFSVMKDAAATVMYGARSANGIVSVVTKAGREGPVKVNARMDYQVAMPTRVPEFLDGVSYMRLYNEARMTRDFKAGPFYSEQKIMATERGDHPLLYPDVDWYDMLFKRQTMNTKASMNVSGGGRVGTYFVSMGYENENGLLKVDKQNNFNSNIAINRFNMRTNVIFNLTPTTKLDTRISGRFQRYNGPNQTVNDIWLDIIRSNPVDFPPVYEPDAETMGYDFILFGSVRAGSGGANDYNKPNAYANTVRGFESRNENTVTVMATLMQDLNFLTPGLKFQLKASLSNWGKFSTRRQYTPRYFALESYNQITGEHKLVALPPFHYPSLGRAVQDKESDSKYYLESMLNWSQKYGNHNLAGTLVGILQDNIINPRDSELSDMGFELMPERNLGISGRISYDYDTRYFADFSFGYNGSEKFTGEKRWGFFPAVGVGWMLSNEEFWQPMKNVVSSIKLKATAGKSGNDAITDRRGRFAYLSNITYGGRGYEMGTTFLTGYGGYRIGRYANPDITWELSTQYNVGTEISLFRKEVVKIQADFFHTDRSRIYMDRTFIPASAGLEVGTIRGNTGRIKSHGVDGSMDIQHFFSQDFWLSSRVNFTYSTNKLVEIDEPTYRGQEHLMRKGRNFYQKNGLLAERLFVDQSEIDNSPRQDISGSMYEAGDIKYKDINGDGIITTDDMIYMGYPTTPEIQYGFGASMGYKDFDFSFFFQGNARVSFFIEPTTSVTDAGIPKGIAPFHEFRNALKLIERDHWSLTNPNEHAFYPRLSVSPLANNTVASSWWLREGSFMRLKTVEIGYKLPFANKWGMQQCRIYFVGENLFVISPFKLWDPELKERALAYPPNKRYNIGININF